MSHSLYFHSHILFTILVKQHMNFKFQFCAPFSSLPLLDRFKENISLPNQSPEEHYDYGC